MFKGSGSGFHFTTFFDYGTDVVGTSQQVIDWFHFSCI
jgi:hypothetical protein